MSPHKQAPRWVRLGIYVLLFLLVAGELLAYYDINLGVSQQSLPDLVLVALNMLTGFDILRRQRVTRAEVQLGSLLALIAIFAFLATFSAVAPGRHQGALPRFYGALTIPFIVLHWTRDEAAVKALRQGFIWAGVLGVISAGLHAFGLFSLPENKDQMAASRLSNLNVLPGMDIPRSGGLLDTMGNYGSFVAAAVFLLLIGFLSQARERWGFSRVGAWLAPVLAVASVLFSQSRSGVLALGFGLLFFITSVVSSGRSKTRQIRALVFVPALAVLVYFFYKIIFWMIGIDTTSSVGRIAVDQLALEKMIESPLIGLGFRAVWALTDSISIVHNSFLSIGVALGLPGLLCYLLLFGLGLVAGLRCIARRDATSPIALGLMASFFAVLVEMNLYDGASDTTVFVLIGMLIALHRNFGPPRRRVQPRRRPDRVAELNASAATARSD